MAPLDKSCSCLSWRNWFSQKWDSEVYISKLDIKLMSLVSILDLWSHSPSPALYDTCLKKLLCILSVSEMIKTMRTGETLGRVETHGKPPAKVELYSRFLKSPVQTWKFIQLFVYVGHLCLCRFVKKGPECLAPLKCPEVQSRGSSFFSTGEECSVS